MQATTDTVIEPVGSALVDALTTRLAAGDIDDAVDLYAEDAVMTALLPSRVDEYLGREEIGAAMHRWFGGHTVEVVTLDAVDVGFATRLSYLLFVGRGDGDSLIEQHQFVTVEGGVITRSRLICSGFQSVLAAASAPGPHTDANVVEFDARDLGCGTGLASAFRARLTAVEVGTTLRTIAHDPAAREELPALARMLGHSVGSITENVVGTTVIDVIRTH